MEFYRFKMDKTYLLRLVPYTHKGEPRTFHSVSTLETWNGRTSKIVRHFFMTMDEDKNLKVFICGNSIYTFLSNWGIENPSFFDLKNPLYLKVIVDQKMGFIDPKPSHVSDENAVLLKSEADKVWLSDLLRDQPYNPTTVAEHWLHQRRGSILAENTGIILAYNEFSGAVRMKWLHEADFVASMNREDKKVTIKKNRFSVSECWDFGNFTEALKSIPSENTFPYYPSVFHVKMWFGFDLLELDLNREELFLAAKLIEEKGWYVTLDILRQDWRGLLLSQNLGIV